MTNKISEVDVKKSLQDAGYIALGIGVLGFQEAQKGVRSVNAKLGNFRGSAGERVSQVSDDTRKQFENVQAKVDEATRDARERAGTLRGEVRTRVGSISDEVRDRADSATHVAKQRMEPVVEQVQTLPSSASKAVNEGRTRAEKLVKRGSDKATSASSSAASSASPKTSPKAAAKASTN